MRFRSSRPRPSSSSSSLHKSFQREHRHVGVETAVLTEEKVCLGIFALTTALTALLNVLDKSGRWRSMSLAHSLRTAPDDSGRGKGAPRGISTSPPVKMIACMRASGNRAVRARRCEVHAGLLTRRCRLAHHVTASNVRGRRQTRVRLPLPPLLCSLVRMRNA